MPVTVAFQTHGRFSNTEHEDHEEDEGHDSYLYKKALRDTNALQFVILAKKTRAR
jgi:hypothetical protein